MLHNKKAILALTLLLTPILTSAQTIGELQPQEQPAVISSTPQDGATPTLPSAPSGGIMILDPKALSRQKPLAQTPRNCKPRRDPWKCKPPAISDFSVNPPRSYAGQRVALNFKIDNGEKYKVFIHNRSQPSESLLKEGVIPKGGRATIMVDPKETTDFRLEAFNPHSKGNPKVERKITLQVLAPGKLYAGDQLPAKGGFAPAQPKTTVILKGAKIPGRPSTGVIEKGTGDQRTSGVKNCDPTKDKWKCEEPKIIYFRSEPKRVLATAGRPALLKFRVTNSQTLKLYQRPLGSNDPGDWKLFKDLSMATFTDTDISWGVQPINPTEYGIAVANPHAGTTATTAIDVIGAMPTEKQQTTSTKANRVFLNPEIAAGGITLPERTFHQCEPNGIWRCIPASIGSFKPNRSTAYQGSQVNFSFELINWSSAKLVAIDKKTGREYATLWHDKNNVPGRKSKFDRSVPGHNPDRDTIYRLMVSNPDTPGSITEDRFVHVIPTGVILLVNGQSKDQLIMPNTKVPLSVELRGTDAAELYTWEYPKGFSGKREQEKSIFKRTNLDPKRSYKLNLKPYLVKDATEFILLTRNPSDGSSSTSRIRVSVNKPEVGFARVDHAEMLGGFDSVPLGRFVDITVTKIKHADSVELEYASEGGNFSSITPRQPLPKGDYSGDYTFKNINSSLFSGMGTLRPKVCTKNDFCVTGGTFHVRPFQAAKIRIPVTSTIVNVPKDKLPVRLKYECSFNMNQFIATNAGNSGNESVPSRIIQHGNGTFKDTIEIDGTLFSARFSTECYVRQIAFGKHQYEGIGDHTTHNIFGTTFTFKSPVRSDGKITPRFSFRSANKDGVGIYTSTQKATIHVDGYWKCPGICGPNTLPGEY